MPYAVDHDYFQKNVVSCSLRGEQFRASLHLRAGRPVVLFSGKLMDYKRPQDLLQAWILLFRKNMNPLPYLLFVGDGVLRKKLESMVDAAGARESVRFIGFLNQSEISAYYDLCDVFVLPSDAEPWGLVVNEVMNFARPVIVSDKVGCGPDLVKNGVNGHIFPVYDVNMLARYIEILVKDKNTLRQYGNNSVNIINSWNYDKDIEALHAALDMA